MYFEHGGQKFSDQTFITLESLGGGTPPAKKLYASSHLTAIERAKLKALALLGKAVKDPWDTWSYQLLRNVEVFLQIEFWVQTLGIRAKAHAAVAPFKCMSGKVHLVGQHSLPRLCYQSTYYQHLGSPISINRLPTAQCCYDVLIALLLVTHTRAHVHQPKYC